MTFGSFISTRRKEAKLNLRDTAKHLGISNGYLCDIEQGRRPAPEGAFVERISSFLELDKQEHEMLLDLVWHEDYTYYSRKAINNHISNIRKKLRVAPGLPEYVKSVYGVGYKFEV